MDNQTPAKGTPQKFDDTEAGKARAAELKHNKPGWTQEQIDGHEAETERQRSEYDQGEASAV